MNNLTLEDLLTLEQNRIIFHAIGGSYAYGTNTPTSDKDTMGVFVMNKDYYLTCNDVIKQLSLRTQ